MLQVRKDALILLTGQCGEDVVLDEIFVLLHWHCDLIQVGQV